MADDASIKRLLAELIPIVSSAVSDEEISKHFTSVIASTFGIEHVSMDDMHDESAPPSALGGYLFNTRKPYIDNQLSEFSSFPELINYRNNGYRSCALMPVIVNGRLIAVLSLLSTSENRFTEELIGSISFGAYLVGFALMYKHESNRNLSIANYFNGAFNAVVPQMIVSSDGSVVKANSTAIRALELPAHATAHEIGLDFGQLAALVGKSAKVQHKGRVYNVGTSKISDKLLHVSMQDITELEMLGAAMAAMQGSTQIGAVLLDHDLNIVAVTDAFSSITGYNKDMLQGKSFTGLLPESSKASFKQDISADSGKPLHGTLEVAGLKTASTRLRYALADYMLGYVLLFVNAQAENYISAVSTALTDFISNASELVIVADTLGYIKECNMPVEAMLHYSRNELIGRDVKGIYADPALFERDVKYVISGTKADNSYVDFIAKDNSRVSTTCSMRLVRDMNGDASYVIFAKELETKRLLQDQEGRIKEMANEANKLKANSDLKSQFIYNISHELKTPLTNIKGFSSLLYSGEFGTLNEEQRSYAATITQEADRLMLIIQQVLDAAKLEANKVKLELKEVDLRELANSHSIMALQEAALNKHLEFSWTASYDVPKITADPNRLIQVFVNLIGNAVKFTEQGGITVKVFKRSKKTVECDVIDTGIGISDEDKRKIFKKFYEAPKKGLVKQDGAGTGLGLSITKEIIRLHGGKIGFESQPGKGSKFWFSLPIKPKSKKRSADQVT
jgi:signal transduction histidine kinase